MIYCPNWAAKMGNNLEAIMKVMRFASRRGRSSFDLYSIVPNGTRNVLEYPLSLKVVERYRSKKLDVNAMIPVCFLKSTNEGTYHKEMYGMSSCEYFQPVFTDFGMCHAFNPTPVIDLLQKSYFSESFFSAYQHDLILNGSIYNGSESGDSFKFYLLGNHRIRHTSHGRGQLGSELLPSTFHFGLSNKDEYFSMRSSNQIIPAGHKMTWKLQAMEIIPSPDMNDISINSRKCRLPHETDGLKIFKSYTKSACEYEFRLKKARNIE